VEPCRGSARVCGGLECLDDEWLLLLLLLRAADEPAFVAVPAAAGAKLIVDLGDTTAAVRQASLRWCWLSEDVALIRVETAGPSLSLEEGRVQALGCRMDQGKLESLGHERRLAQHLPTGALRFKLSPLGTSWIEHDTRLEPRDQASDDFGHRSLWTACCRVLNQSS
jgi:hypothetical protein